MKNERHAIITGASTGIGFATAEIWLKTGNSATFIGRRANALQNTKRRLVSSGVLENQIDLFPGDAANPEQMTKLFSGWKRPHLDLIVQAAGQRFTGSGENTNLENWKSSMESNLFSAVVLPPLALPLLRKSAKENRSPCIVNIANALAMKASAGMIAYSTAKAALAHYTKCLALELANEGIRVNAVAPAAVDTEMLRSGANDAAYENFKKDLAAYHPLGRIGTAEEIARGILFLAAPENSWITGTVLNIDGGYSLK